MEDEGTTLEDFATVIRVVLLMTSRLLPMPNSVIYSFLGDISNYYHWYASHLQPDVSRRSRDRF
jgi:hypothetical protein